MLKISTAPSPHAGKNMFSSIIMTCLFNIKIKIIGFNLIIKNKGANSNL